MYFKPPRPDTRPSATGQFSFFLYGYTLWSDTNAILNMDCRTHHLFFPSRLFNVKGMTPHRDHRAVPSSILSSMPKESARVKVNYKDKIQASAAGLSTLHLSYLSDESEATESCPDMFRELLLNAFEFELNPMAKLLLL